MKLIYVVPRMLRGRLSARKRMEIILLPRQELACILQRWLRQVLQGMPPTPTLRVLSHLHVRVQLQLVLRSWSLLPRLEHCWREQHTRERLTGDYVIYFISCTCHTKSCIHVRINECIHIYMYNDMRTYMQILCLHTYIIHTCIHALTFKIIQEYFSYSRRDFYVCMCVRASVRARA